MNIEELQTSLKKALQYNEAFDFLVGAICKAGSLAASYQMMRVIDREAMDELVSAIDVAITSSGQDRRVISFCQSLVGIAGLSSHELKVLGDGTVVRRKVYFAQRRDGAIKIGSSIDVDLRMKTLRSGAGEVLEVIYSINGSTAKEKSFHQLFAPDRIDSEWFLPTNVLAFIGQLRRDAAAIEAKYANLH